MIFKTLSARFWLLFSPIKPKVEDCKKCRGKGVVRKNGTSQRRICPMCKGRTKVPVKI